MCNLYSLTTNQEAIRRLFRIHIDRTGNLPSLPAIFPDQCALVIRAKGAEREMLMMRWCIAGPKQFGEKPVTNVRNVKSAHWRPWADCPTPTVGRMRYEYCATNTRSSSSARR